MPNRLSPNPHVSEPSEADTFGSRLERAIGRSGLAKQEVARLAGKTASELSDYLGDNHKPGYPTIQKLAKAVGVKPDDLIPPEPADAPRGSVKKSGKQVRKHAKEPVSRGMSNDRGDHQAEREHLGEAIRRIGARMAVRRSQNAPPQEIERMKREMDAVVVNFVELSRDDEHAPHELTDILADLYMSDSSRYPVAPVNEHEQKGKP